MPSSSSSLYGCGRRAPTQEQCTSPCVLEPLPDGQGFVCVPKPESLYGATLTGNDVARMRDILVRLLPEVPSRTFQDVIQNLNPVLTRYIHRRFTEAITGRRHRTWQELVRTISEEILEHIHEGCPYCLDDLSERRSDSRRVMRARCCGRPVHRKCFEEVANARGECICCKQEVPKDPKERRAVDWRWRLNERADVALESARDRDQAAEEDVRERVQDLVRASVRDRAGYHESESREILLDHHRKAVERSRERRAAARDTLGNFQTIREHVRDADASGSLHSDRGLRSTLSDVVRQAQETGERLDESASWSREIEREERERLEQRGRRVWELDSKWKDADAELEEARARHEQNQARIEAEWQRQGDEARARHEQNQAQEATEQERLVTLVVFILAVYHVIHNMVEDQDPGDTVEDPGFDED